MNDALFDWRGEYDENLPLPEHLSMEQYRRVIFRPDAHFVDGQIVARNLGDMLHGQTVGTLATAFHKFAESGVGARISLRLQVSPERIRVCDLVLLERAKDIEPIPSTAPLLCIEVLAQDQTAETELASLADYRAMGVPNVWLLDPNHQRVYIFDEAGLHPSDQNELSLAGTQLRVKLSELLGTTEYEN